MDKLTKKRAIAKINAMRYVLSHDDDYVNESKIEKKYHSFELNLPTYFENILKLRGFKKNSEISRLGKVINTVEIPFSISMVNAVYMPRRNAFS